jgi:hypothetical protein
LFIYGHVARNGEGVIRVKKKGGERGLGGGELRSNIQNGVENSFGSYRVFVIEVVT